MSAEFTRCDAPNLDRSNDGTPLDSKSCDDALRVDAHVPQYVNTAAGAASRALNVEFCICKEQGIVFVANLTAALYQTDGVGNASASNGHPYKDVYDAVGDDELVDAIADLSRKTQKRRLALVDLHAIHL
jgi:hypothetical protein